jgi:hypothetical protein
MKSFAILGPLPDAPAVTSLTPTLPIPLTTVSLWLDAADIATITVDGSSVIQWSDKSGNGNNSTSASGTYNANGINNKGTITNPKISGPISNSGNSNVSIFIVATLANTGGNYDNLLALNSSNITNYYAPGSLFIAYYGSTNPPGLYAFMNGNLSTNFKYRTNTPFIFETVQNGRTGSTYGNGNSFGDVQTPGNTFNYSNYYIGECIGGPAWLGNVSEVIICNTALSPTDRQKVEGYLAWKWGIQTNLPQSHPYASQAPVPAPV